MDIPLIGFGTYQLPNTYENVLLALQLGYRHIDTATLYKNEAQVGQAIRDSGINRSEIFITTKISLHDIKKNNIKEAVDYCLTTLNCDYIDLVLLHAPILSNNLINVKAYQELCLVKNMLVNKIRYIGVSNYNKKQLLSINHLPKPYVNQIEVTPFCKKSETVAYCKENDIKIVAHSSLYYLKEYEKIKELQQYDIANIMLSWAIHNSYCIIPKSTNKEHMLNNLILSPNKEKILDNVQQSFCKYPHFNEQ